MLSTASKTLAAPTTSMIHSHLGQRDFAMMLGVAMAIHVVLLIGYSLLPKQDAMTVPVRVLQLKVGGGEGDGMQMSAPPKPVAEKQKVAEKKVVAKAQPKPAPVKKTVAKPKVIEKKVKVSSAPAKPIKKKVPVQQPKEQPKLEEKKAPEKLESVTVSEPVNPYSLNAPAPTQFVRTPEASAGGTGQNTGVVEGETPEQARARYEQIIALWIKRHIRYPEIARQRGEKGEGMVRIRIDRNGKVRFTSIERSTGYRTLDQEMLDTVNRANPVPAVPANYPAGSVLEFLIPMRLGQTFN